MEQAEYTDFVSENDLPIFFHSWWLDALSHRDNWGVCISKDKDGSIVGVLPYYFTSFLNQKIIRTPPFTPYIGVWLKYPEGVWDNRKKISFENKIIDDLLDQLPKVAWYHQIHPGQLENWLPFHWQGFRQSTRYHFIIKKERLGLEIKKEQKKNIRTGEKYFKIIETQDAESNLSLVKKSYSRQGAKADFPESIYFLLAEAIFSKNQGLVLQAVDRESKRTIASQFLLWDSKYIYLWMHGLDRSQPNFRGASSILIWHAIQLAKKKNLDVNFCGSMLPGVAHFNESFGAEMMPVHQIYKASNRFLYVLRELLPR